MKPVILHATNPVREHHIHPNAIVEVVVKEGGVGGWIACSDGESFDFTDDPQSVIAAWTAELDSNNRANRNFVNKMIRTLQGMAPNLVGELPDYYDDEDFGEE